MHSRGGVLAVLAVAACAPRFGKVSELTAPPGASWKTARLQTAWAKESGGGGHGFGPGTYEMSAVEVVIDDAAPVVLASLSSSAPMVMEPHPHRDLIKGPFALAADPAGRWIGASNDGGAHWWLVEPASAMACHHLLVAGPEATLWTRAPSPSAVAAELLYAEAEQPGPLGLTHEFSGDWPRHSLASEGDGAVRFALAHPGDAVVFEAAVAALEGLSDGSANSVGANVTRLVAARAKGDPAVQQRVARVFATASLEHLGAVARAMEVLEEAGTPEVDAKAGGWASLAVADQAGLTKFLHDAQSGAFGLPQPWWVMARRAFAAGKVDQAVVTAAKAWVTYFREHLEVRKLQAWETDVEPWRLGYPEQATLAYAVMLLGLAGQKAFLEGLPHQQKPEVMPWPPTFGKGATLDARGGKESVSVSGWIVAATR